MDNFVFYGDWAISWKPVEPVGWIFYIDFLLPRGKQKDFDSLKLEVGFFRDLEKGKESCKHLSELCRLKIKSSVVSLVAQYSRNRHDRFRAIREILGREEYLMTDIENSEEGKDNETP
ncbi:hypothetical protein [Chamaesiphon sp. VAR_48_metabat_403]|uniref:hypothetical protein n=1 Tax=Chamaesiphon sp. VAR_48_metabat_403 TaxID=2964700 RepID=UPI00286D8839|nr:hypothetical protein [Chamaesiphon sp. VAR_48_metabat_403]